MSVCVCTVPCECMSVGRSGDKVGFVVVIDDHDE